MEWMKEPFTIMICPIIGLFSKSSLNVEQDIINLYLSNQKYFNITLSTAEFVILWKKQPTKTPRTANCKSTKLTEFRIWR